MALEYTCSVCKEKFIFQSMNKLLKNQKEKIKYFCCENCYSTEKGEFYLKLKLTRKKIINNLVVLIFSLFGTAIYLYIIIYLILK